MKKKKVVKADCISCARELVHDEIGITQKLLGEDVSEFYCMDCLADYLEVSTENLLAKIEEFKEQGCTLFG